MTPGDNKKELLIISFSYAPMLNPRAFRWTALAEEFALRGMRVRVVSSWQPGLQPREVLNGVEIHRVGNRLAETVRAALARSRGSRQQAADASKLKPKAGLGSIFSWVWRKIVWPDTSCIWYWPALGKARELLLGAADTTIVSVSPTFTAALVGYAIKKQQNSHRWLIDMGDPFSIAEESPPNNFSSYRKLNKRAEHALFKQADAVALTNENMRQIYAYLYPGSAQKFAVIPPLLGNQALSTASRAKSSKVSSPSIRIVFVGTLYRKLRRPDFLLLLFNELSSFHKVNTMELHFYGNTDECNDAFIPYAESIGKTIWLHGAVTQAAAALAISAADIVVNLGNTNPNQLPSKLVEYAGAGKPILNIVSAVNDSSASFMTGYQYLLTLHDSGATPTPTQVQQTLTFITESVRHDACETSRWADKFTITPIADQYQAIFSRAENTAMKITHHATTVPVSVVIPCYRSATTIERAIASVAAQSAGPLELIVVNDGDDGNLASVLQDIKNRYGNARFVIVTLSRNLGAGQARNAGWDIAQGDYIAFLDADDAWHPRKLEMQYRYMQNNPEIVLCGHRHRQQAADADWVSYDLDTRSNQIGLMSLLASNRFITPSAMVRNRPDIRFPAYRHMEDFALWLAIAATGGKIAKMTAELACIYKPPYGTSGLSAALFSMQAGELKAYWNVCRVRPILFLSLPLLILYSTGKFVRRLLLVALR